MKHRLILSFALLALVASGARKPDNVPPGVWVREDLFAGYLADDMKTFERGEQKVDELLAEKPDSAGLQAWKMSAVIYRAVRSFEAGDRAAFDTGYKRAIDTLESLLNKAPKDVAVKAIYGGMISTVGHRLPPDIQLAANRRASEVFLQLEELQKAQFDKMPVHHRGEVLAGVAQAAARSGQDQLARTYLTRIVNTMEGTPYAAFARDMLHRPESMKKIKIACNTCHEPNRLANFYKGDQ
jgi:hypothetical protein